MSKYGVFSGPYFHVFGVNAGKYGPEKNSVFGHLSRSENVRSSENFWFFNFENFKLSQKIIAQGLTRALKNIDDKVLCNNS